MSSEKLNGIFDVGKQVVNYWRGPWIDHATILRSWLMSALRRGRALDITLAPKALDKAAFVLASGPSLDDTDWPMLAAMRADGHAVFVATSNLTAALAHGVIPTHVVVVDANHTVPKHVAPYYDLLHDTILVAPPIVAPALLKKWPGPLHVFKPIQMGDPFIMDVLPTMYSYRTDITQMDRHWREAITVGFLNAGCYTNGAVLVAAFYNYAPIVMLGNDLGFAYGRSRLTTYGRQGDTWYPIPPHAPTTRDTLRRANNGVWTTTEFLHYKLNLFIVWRLSQAKLYNTSAVGSLSTDEIPYVTQADAYRDWRALRDAYLDTSSDAFHDHVRVICERMGMTIVAKDGGLQFDEVKVSSEKVVVFTPITVPMMSQPTHVRST